MKYKLEINVEKDTFQDIADRLTDFFNTRQNYISTSREVKSWLEDNIECGKDNNGVSIYEMRGGLRITYKGVDVSFNYKTRKTGKTQKVSKLRRVELYEFDKVVFQEFQTRPSIPNFNKIDGDWKVEKNNWTHSVNSPIYRGKSYAKHNFKQALEESILNLYYGKDDTVSLKDVILNSMSQPYYKTICNVAMKSKEEAREKFDEITRGVEMNNQELLEECLNEYKW